MTNIHYLEDWVLCLHGTIDVKGEAAGHWASFSPPFRLATYDVGFVSSVAEGIEIGIGLTDRQVATAVKVITKYKRNWLRLGLDPSYLLTQEIPMRLPMREIDRTNAIKLVDNKLHLTFRYHADLITALYNNAAQACGEWEFIKEGGSKYWKVDYTEGNIASLVRLKNFGDIPFEIQPELQPVFALAKTIMEQDLYRPLLNYADGKMEILNAPAAARDFLIEQGWQSDSPKLLHWALLAARAGLEVTDTLLAEIGPSGKMFAESVSVTNYEGVSSMTWDEFDELYKDSDYSFLCVYRTRELDQIRKIMPDDERINYLDAGDMNYGYGQQVKPAHEYFEKFGINPRNTIIVTDMIIGSTRARSKLTPHCLGMLYMIPDNWRKNVNLQAGAEG